MESIGRFLCRGKTYAFAAALAAGASLLNPIGARAVDVPEEGSWAFNYVDNNFKDTAMLDLRSMNEQTAGSHGFLKLSKDGDSFVTGDDQPIRFWAANSSWSGKPEDVEENARFLAKLGVNMIRIHAEIPNHKDGAKIEDANQEEIDHIWRAVAAYKKAGIYCTISPYWANSQSPPSWGVEGNDNASLNGLLFFNPKVQQGYKSWVKQLYTPKNPYTGMSLAEDPAVGIIQVQNEDSLLFWTTQNMKPEQQHILGTQFAAWLAKKYGSLDKAIAAWQGANAQGDDLPGNAVGILPMWVLVNDQTGGMAKRAADQTQFFAETMYNFYHDIRDYYHNTLGCKQLVNASNWITASNIKLGDTERYTYTATDVEAVNRYYGGTHDGVQNQQGWRIDPGDRYTDPSACLNVRNLPTNLIQPVGHPMMITESSWVNPMSYQSEGPLLMAAYQSLTGVDCFYWFVCTAPEYHADPYFNFINMRGGHAINKWTCSTPELAGMFPATSLMFRKGYIKQASQPALMEERSLDDLWNQRIPMIAEDASFDPNRYSGKTGSAESNIKGGIDPLAFLIGPVRAKFGGDPDQSKAVDLSKYIDTGKKVIHSLTGEITMDYHLGVCTIDAPKAKGATGFLKKVGTIELNDLTITTGNTYATIAVVSMDDQPLTTSGKILVQVGTIARPTGWTTRAARTSDKQLGFQIVNTGHMPYRVVNTDMTLSLHNPNITKATLLDTGGYAVKTIDGQNKGGSFEVKLPPEAMYVVLESGAAK